MVAKIAVNSSVDAHVAELVSDQTLCDMESLQIVTEVHGVLHIWVS